MTWHSLSAPLSSIAHSSRARSIEDYHRGASAPRFRVATLNIHHKAFRSLMRYFQSIIVLHFYCNTILAIEKASMELKKQSKARNAERPRTETLTFRLSKRLRSLAEVAARKKGVTLANHVETALEASLEAPVDFLRGASIAAVADELYDEDDALCFLKRLKKYPWSMSPEQKRLLDLIHTSPLFYPSFRVYNTALITEHWPELSAVAAGTADPP